ncbi:hypothetical protein GCM10027020_14090 [Nocardioides salsibiostraticola]
MNRSTSTRFGPASLTVRMDVVSPVAGSAGTGTGVVLVYDVVLGSSQPGATAAGAGAGAGAARTGPTALRAPTARAETDRATIRERNREVGGVGLIDLDIKWSLHRPEVE